MQKTQIGSLNRYDDLGMPATKNAAASVMEVLWTKPTHLVAFLENKKGWQKQLATAANISVEELSSVIKTMNKTEFNRMAQENPAGLEPGKDLSQIRMAPRAYDSWYTRDTACCPTQTMYSCNTNATCGTCMCQKRPLAKSAAPVFMALKK